MSLTIALVSAARALVPLPERGLALETKAGVHRGFDLAFDQAAAHVVVLRNRRGALYSFDGHALRPRARRRTGHWIWRERSPDGGAKLAQWSGECEIPIAYLIVNGKPRKVADETVALGWLGREAVVHFRPLGCAGSGRSGIYAVPVRGTPRLLLRTPRFAQYLMWGG